MHYQKRNESLFILTSSSMQESRNNMLIYAVLLYSSRVTSYTVTLNWICIQPAWGEQSSFSTLSVSTMIHAFMSGNGHFSIMFFRPWQIHDAFMLCFRWVCPFMVSEQSFVGQLGWFLPSNVVPLSRPHGFRVEGQLYWIRTYIHTLTHLCCFSEAFSSCAPRTH